jgi:hypothetical protein
MPGYVMAHRMQDEMTNPIAVRAGGVGSGSVIAFLVEFS